MDGVDSSFFMFTTRVDLNKSNKHPFTGRLTYDPNFQKWKFKSPFSYLLFLQEQIKGIIIRAGLRLRNLIRTESESLVSLATRKEFCTVWNSAR